MPYSPAVRSRRFLSHPTCQRVTPALRTPVALENRNWRVHMIVPSQIFQGCVSMDLFTKVLVTIGSSASIGFGIWHFFVPKAWNWYSYIEARATELIIAVRAINVFFSLALVLFGVVNILFIYKDKSNRYSIIVMLAATSILWITRVIFQIIYPQGSINLILQYGMLSAFIIVSLCYIIPLAIMVSQEIRTKHRKTQTDSFK